MARTMSIKRPKSLSESVAERLRQAIIDGELPFGTMLTEDALAEALDVSRTPVREALSHLQREGIIDIVAQRGSYVFTPDEQDVVELCEYRLTLEVRAANLSMQRDPQGLLGALEGLIAEMEAALREGDIHGYALLDWRYHSTMFAFCDNRYMREAFALASAKIAALSTNITRPFPDKRKQSFNEHKIMLAHIRDVRIEAFERVLAEHIGRTRSVYLTALQSGQLQEPRSDAVKVLRLEDPVENA